MATLRKRFREHPLISLLINLKGNPKACILMEPLWGIPYNLIAPFVTVYMYAMGVDDRQIGLLLSIAMVAQVFLSFIGGMIADKLGRRFTTNIGDFVGWALACAVWAISQNFWFFLVAMLLNCFEQINQTAWYCLLIEDAEQKDVLGIHTWITIAGLLAVFFAPLSGVLVDRFSVVPVVRVLYGIFAVTMTIKVIVTVKYTKETTQGMRRMAESRSVPIRTMVKEYKHVLPLITRSRSTIQTLAIMVLFQITSIVTSNFMSLYFTQDLMIPEQYLAYFPILRAIVMLVFLFAVQQIVDKLRMKVPMSAGLVLYIVSQLLVILLPVRSVVGIVVYTLLEAVAFGLFMPRKEAMLSLSVNPKERARIVSLLTSIMILLSSPFGYLAGFLSSLDRRLPFCLNILLFIAMLVVIAKYQEPRYDIESEEDGNAKESLLI